MEIPGLDNRNASEAVMLSRTELEALVDHHRAGAKGDIERGNHPLVEQRMKRIEQLRRLMPHTPRCDF